MPRYVRRLATARHRDADHRHTVASHHQLLGDATQFVLLVTDHQLELLVFTLQLVLQEYMRYDGQNGCGGGVVWCFVQSALDCVQCVM